MQIPIRQNNADPSDRIRIHNIAFSQVDLDPDQGARDTVSVADWDPSTACTGEDRTL
jgi:hypothetical protein